MGSDIKIACLGPEETFSHLAAKKYFRESIKLSFLNLFEACQAVRNRKVDFAVVPIENNIGGFILDTIRAMRETKDIIISDEIYLPIKHQLISHSVSLKDIGTITIYSHQQAFIQCTKTLNLLEKELGCKFLKIQTQSTSAGVELSRGKPKSGAIASREASVKYGVPIIREDIQDSRSNTTRFFVIRLGKIAVPCQHNKSAFLLEVQDQPGALVNILNFFSKDNINIKYLIPHPVLQPNQTKWEYVYFLECEGHANKELDRIYRYLSEPRHKSLKRRIRLLGSFPDRLKTKKYT